MNWCARYYSSLQAIWRPIQFDCFSILPLRYKRNKSSLETNNMIGITHLQQINCKKQSIQFVCNYQFISDNGYLRLATNVNHLLAWFHLWLFFFLFSRRTFFFLVFFLCYWDYFHPHSSVEYTHMFYWMLIVNAKQIYLYLYC